MKKMATQVALSVLLIMNCDSIFTEQISVVLFWNMKLSQVPTSFITGDHATLMFCLKVTFANMS